MRRRKNCESLTIEIKKNFYPARADQTPYYSNEPLQTLADNSDQRTFNAGDKFGTADAILLDGIIIPPSVTTAVDYLGNAKLDSFSICISYSKMISHLKSEHLAHVLDSSRRLRRRSTYAEPSVSLPQISYENSHITSFLPSQEVPLSVRRRMRKRSNSLTLSPPIIFSSLNTALPAGGHRVRLLNALRRRWHRVFYDVRTLDLKVIAWDKDADVEPLYGPLYLCARNSDFQKEDKFEKCPSGVISLRRGTTNYFSFYPGCTLDSITTSTESISPDSVSSVSTLNFSPPSSAVGNEKLPNGNKTKGVLKLPSFGMDTLDIIVRSIRYENLSTAHPGMYPIAYSQPKFSRQQVIALLKSDPVYSLERRISSCYCYLRKCTCENTIPKFYFNTLPAGAERPEGSSSQSSSDTLRPSSLLYRRINFCLIPKVRYFTRTDLEVYRTFGFGNASIETQTEMEIPTISIHSPAFETPVTVQDLVVAAPTPTEHNATEEPETPTTNVFDEDHSAASTTANQIWLMLQFGAFVCRYLWTNRNEARSILSKLFNRETYRSFFDDSSDSYPNKTRYVVNNEKFEKFICGKNGEVLEKHNFDVTTNHFLRDRSICTIKTVTATLDRGGVIETKTFTTKTSMDVPEDQQHNISADQMIYYRDTQEELNKKWFEGFYRNLQALKAPKIPESSKEPEIPESTVTIEEIDNDEEEASRVAGPSRRLAEPRRPRPRVEPLSDDIKNFWKNRPIPKEIRDLKSKSNTRESGSVPETAIPSDKKAKENIDENEIGLQVDRITDKRSSNSQAEQQIVDIGSESDTPITSDKKDEVNVGENEIDTEIGFIMEGSSNAQEEQQNVDIVTETSVSDVVKDFTDSEQAIAETNNEYITVSPVDVRLECDNANNLDSTKENEASKADIIAIDSEDLSLKPANSDLPEILDDTIEMKPTSRGDSGVVIDETLIPSDESENEITSKLSPDGVVREEPKSLDCDEVVPSLKTEYVEQTNELFENNENPVKCEKTLTEVADAPTTSSEIEYWTMETMQMSPCEVENAFKRVTKPESESKYPSTSRHLIVDYDAPSTVLVAGVLSDITDHIAEAAFATINQTHKMTSTAVDIVENAVGKTQEYSVAAATKGSQLTNKIGGMIKSGIVGSIDLSLQSAKSLITLPVRIAGSLTRKISQSVLSVVYPEEPPKPTPKAPPSTPIAPKKNQDEHEMRNKQYGWNGEDSSAPSTSPSSPTVHVPLITPKRQYLSKRDFWNGEGSEDSDESTFEDCIEQLREPRTHREEPYDDPFRRRTIDEIDLSDPDKIPIPFGYLWGPYYETQEWMMFNDPNFMRSQQTQTGEETPRRSEQRDNVIPEVHPRYRDFLIDAGLVRGTKSYWPHIH
ncbi:hypothetical protein HK098_000057 [Nowakowskiella sp. JEL0407]|nr:hypothetical protein HK098_000057 [Nowakowskiella sp. JEL0407]